MTPYPHVRATPRRARPADDLVGLFSRCSAGDPQARETIILRFLPLARRLAWDYEGRGEPIDDLLQVANVGLIKAVDGYALDRGAFAPYARSRILGEIRRHFRDATWRVHVPRPLRERASLVAQAEADVGAAAGPGGRTAAIAAHLDLDPAEVAEAKQAWDVAYQPPSLDAGRALSAGRRAAEWKGPVADEPDYERVEVSVALERALRDLERRDRLVVLLRLYCELTQCEIAARVGLSQMHVSRILRRAGALVASACGLVAAA